MPNTHLDCAVCGLPAGRWRQWGNQDNGYGVCGECAHTYLPSLGVDELEIRKRYGEPGVHYQPKPAEEKPVIHTPKNPLDHIESSKHEIEAAADALLYPGNGGIAIWVRCDELQPRAAIRLRGNDMPLEESVTLMAALRFGLKAMEDRMAAKHGLDPAAYASMIGTAQDLLAPLMTTETRDRPSKKE